MNDTPRTDKAIKESNGQWSYALADTCKQLERELTAMTEQRDEERECLERCARARCELGASLRSRIVYFENQRDRLAEAMNRIANNNVQDLPETDYAYELGRMEGIAKIALQSLPPPQPEPK